MCDAEEPTQIEWMGWVTTLEALQRKGWEVTRKPPYQSGRDPAQPAVCSEYLYLQEPKSRVVARLTRPLRWTGEEAVWQVDYLTRKRSSRVKSRHVEIERELGEEDVQRLLDLVLAIQSRRPRRRRELPQAEVIALRQA